MMNQSLDFIIPFFLENEPNNEFEVFQKQSDNKTDNNRFDLLCHREGQIMSWPRLNLKEETDVVQETEKQPPVKEIEEFFKFKI